MYQSAYVKYRYISTNESEVSYKQRGEVAHNSAQYNKIYW